MHPMRRHRRGPRIRRQRAFGLALILVILVMGSVAALLSGFSPASVRVDRDKVTERALAQAKAALIGRAARDDYRPGSLPCPDTDGDGSAELFAGINCPAYIGLLPWRTLGLPELRDGSGERLWYALSPNFRDHTAAQPISSDKRGDVVTESASGLSVAGNLVALIIAPERAVAGQARPSANASDYVEFVNPTPPGPAVYDYRLRADSNDSILPISHRDLFTVVDQATFSRMQKSLVPKMQALAAKWGRYPYAMPFNPTVFPATGMPATYEGLLPWVKASTSGARWETPTVTQTGGAGTLNPGTSCSIGPPGVVIPNDKWLTCVIDHTGTVTFRIEVIARDAGRSFHDIAWDAAPTADLTTGDWVGYQWNTPDATSASVRFTGTTTNTNTPVTVRLNIDLAYWADNTYPWVSVPPGACTPPADGMIRAWPRDCDAVWFVANDWQKQTYYALAPAYAFDGGGACGTCLTVNGVTPPTNKRAIVILAGHVRNGTARPSSMIGEYLEGENGTTADNLFETGPRTFIRNDKIAILAP